jgi:hypothetical protein
VSSRIVSGCARLRDALQQRLTATGRGAALVAIVTRVWAIPYSVRRGCACHRPLGVCRSIRGRSPRRRNRRWRSIGDAIAAFLLRPLRRRLVDRFVHVTAASCCGCLLSTFCARLSGLFVRGPRCNRWWRGRGYPAPEQHVFCYRLDRNKLRMARRREGRYLLRTNLTGHDPAKLWTYYLQLVAVVRSVQEAQRGPRHPADPASDRGAYRHRVSCLPPARHAQAPFARASAGAYPAPTTNGRQLLFTRYTQPEPECAC